MIYRVDRILYEPESEQGNGREDASLDIEKIKFTPKNIHRVWPKEHPNHSKTYRPAKDAPHFYGGHMDHPLSD